MCGFAGVLHGSGSPEASLRSHLLRMTRTLRHRGPDDEGTWLDPTHTVGLGFRRLAILDLSAAGHQPMTSPSGRFTMVFNGEIYNFEELRQALRPSGVSFRGHSDSEVVLAAIDQWGLEKTLPKMVGMFAIALWDNQKRELTLIRDRMGIKPLYVAKTSRGIAFASELGALTQAPGFDSTLASSCVAAYLRYLFVPAPGTPFASTQKLPPGHVMRIRADTAVGGVPTSEAYWGVDAVRRQAASQRSGNATRDRRAIVDDLDALLQEAVGMRMVADVPVGALLSGGIDSSLVVALMQRATNQSVRTFTIGFEQPAHDESSHARSISEHLGTRHTELQVTGQDALDIVPLLPATFDEPLADPSQIPTYLVSRLARQQVTVALSGDGGDELFGGYNRYLTGSGSWPRLTSLPYGARKWAGALVGRVPSDAWRRTEFLARAISGRGRLLDRKAEKVARLLGARNPAEMYRMLLSTADDTDALLAQRPSGSDPIWDSLEAMGPGLTLSDMLAVDQKYYLPDDLLQKVDRASMAVSLEIRVPLLDHRVVEFSWGIPNDLKVHGGQGKWILKEVLNRYVPRQLVDRPKTGFSVPIETWLAGPLRAWAEELLLAQSPERDHVFAVEAIRTLWTRFCSGRSEHANLIWAIVMFEAWRREWRITDVQEAA